MNAEVKCPGCKQRLRYDPDLDGRPGICPSCQHLVLPPEDADDAESEDEVDPHAITASTKGPKSLQKVLPIESRVEEVQWEGKSLAREHGIDLEEKLEKTFANKQQAEKELANLKRDLPLVESAYEPSGKLPRSALGLMVLGTWVAALAALVAELIVGAIAALVIALIVAINVASAALGCILCIALVFGVIFGLIAYAAPFCCGGFVAAWVTSEFGRLGKNRNMTATALVSVLATLLATVGLWLVFVFFARGLVDKELNADPDSKVHLIGHGLMALGCLIATATAWIMGRAFVQSAKFCEKCEEFMEVIELKKLGVGPVRAMIEALSVKDMPAAASMQCCEAGPDAKVTLFACPCCQAGFIEAEIDFSVEYEDNGKQTLAESWLVASKKLKATDVAWFKIFKEEAGEIEEPEGGD